MISIILTIITRITSNSYIGVFQKMLTSDGTKSSVVNFYTYLGLSALGILFFPLFNLNFSNEFWINFLAMGILGALGNYFIIKSLSIGELSSIAPINSYKPIVALIIAFFYLNEIPTIKALGGILLIILGTVILYSNNYSDKKALFYRFLALCFSGSEAVFIKKIILLTNVPTSLFLWALSGFIFSSFLVSKQNLKLNSIKKIIILIFLVFIMQLSTNYLFNKMNVSYALALFQLSTILSVFLGANFFSEKGLKIKIFASIVMLFGAIVIILN